MRHVSRSLAGALALGLMLSATGARAETEGERLFKEGRALLAEGKLELACDRFQKSYDLEKATGSLLNLANCEEERKRLIEAEALWKLASEKADTAESRKYASDRMAGVQSKVPSVVLTPAESAEGLEILLDGNVITPGEAIRINPGPHVATVRVGGATKERPFEAQSGEKLRFELAIPGGKVEGTTSGGGGAAAPTPTREAEGTNWAIPGWTSLGIGAAGAVVFGVTAGLVASECDGAGEHVFNCPDGEPTGLLVTNLIGAIVGVAGVGLGVTFLIVDATSGGPDDAATPPSTTVRLSPFVGPNAAGAALGLSF